METEQIHFLEVLLIKFISNSVEFIFPANNGTCSLLSESNWSMMGAVVSIVNAFISIVIIIMLLSMCICYFSHKSKQYSVDGTQLTSKYRL